MAGSKYNRAFGCEYVCSERYWSSSCRTKVLQRRYRSKMSEHPFRSSGEGLTIKSRDAGKGRQECQHCKGARTDEANHVASGLSVKEE